MSELKPCPFCGGEPTESIEDSWGNAAISCQECCYVVLGEKLWNTRATDKSTERLIDAADAVRDNAEPTSEIARGNHLVKSVAILRLIDAIEEAKKK
jgi:hypothetical protein